MDADEANTRSLGATGVPYFVIDRPLWDLGAQPAEAILATLKQAWNEAAAHTD